MKVDIGRLKQMEGETAHFVLDEEWQSLHYGAEELAFSSPVHVELQVTNAGGTMVVQGKILTSVAVNCSRCLESFVYPIDLPYEDEWVASEKATSEQRENALLFDQDEVEIGDRILEHILLGLPMKFTCSPECRGLCPQCGTNLNKSECHCADYDIDPRLAELAKLLQK